MLDATSHSVMTHIYGAAVNPALWAEAMDGVAQFCNAKGAALMIRHPDAHQPDFQALSTSLDAATRSPLGMLFGVRQGQIYNGDWNKLRYMPAGQMYLDTELGHSSRFLDKRSDYRFLRRKLDVRRRVGARLSDDNAWFEAIGIGLRADQDQITRSTKQAFARLLPHLAKATETARLYAQLKAQHNAVLGAFSKVCAGVAIAHPTGEILYANNEAQRILDEASGLRRTENQHIRCYTGRQTARLHAAIVEATHTAAGTELIAPYQMDVERDGQGYPLLCDVVPLCDAAGELHSEPEAALLLMIDPDACSYLSATRFALSYGLTAEETRLCRSLILGTPADQMAEDHNLGHDDLTDRIEKLYRSVGVTDRASLLRRIWRVAPVVY